MVSLWACGCWGRGREPETTASSILAMKLSSAKYSLSESISYKITPKL